MRKLMEGYVSCNDCLGSGLTDTLRPCSECDGMGGWYEEAVSEAATDGKKVDVPVDFVMQQLQQKVTETAYKAQQFSSYIKRKYPEETEKYNVAVEVEMELDRLRKMIFDVR